MNRVFALAWAASNFVALLKDVLTQPLMLSLFFCTIVFSHNSLGIFGLGGKIKRDDWGFEDTRERQANSLSYFLLPLT